MQAKPVVTPSLWQYLWKLWPIIAVFAVAQLTMRLSGNAASIGLPIWLSGVDFLLFSSAFIAAGVWVHAPLSVWSQRRDLSQARHRRGAEWVVSELPWRAAKAFFLVGLLYASALLAIMVLTGVVRGAVFSPRMLLALSLSVFAGIALLAPVLGVVITIAHSTRLRRTFAAANLFVGDLDSHSPARVLTGSARRPWFVFVVTGLVPTALLAIYVFLALGVDVVAERRFIFAQAVVLFAAVFLAGVCLVSILSRTLTIVVGELRQGLERLRQGRFDGRVPVLIDDDMGDLARGLNTAMQGLKEREDLKDSLKIAAEIQQGLLPRKPPKVPGYALLGFQQSCYAVGGDFYDYIILPDDRLWLVIADVAGKGYPAALTVANLQAMLHVLAAENVAFEEAVAYINNTLCKTLTGGRFVTIFLAKLQPQSHSMLWLNAGHVPPLLASNGQVRILEASSPPMGLARDVDYIVNYETLHSGDTLLAYTDGVTEARDRTRATRFGEQRLVEWFEQRQHEPLHMLPELLHASLQQFGQAALEDDLTLLGLRRGEL